MKIKSLKRRPRKEAAKGMIGKIYLERGKPVTVLIRWGKGGGPRNVLIQRQDGTKVVRPFRGLRKSQAAEQLKCFISQYGYLTIHQD